MAHRGLVGGTEGQEGRKRGRVASPAPPLLYLLPTCPWRHPRVFLMREWLELSSEEICKELNLTSTNLYVQLHRARLRLRECLELNWFGQRTENV